MDDITVRVPAKVNLGLAVGPRGPDGYHELVNIFQAVSLFDEVTAAPAAEISVSVEGDSAGAVPAGDDNLAVRAARRLSERAEVSQGVELHIRKTIPVAGGMAGGSADAAAALVACNALWNTEMSRMDLLALAGELGADVAFPLIGGTAIGTGRGEQLTALATPSTFHWVFALAEGGLSAAAVYAECDRLRRERGQRTGPPAFPEQLLTAIRSGDPDALGGAMFNDLQPAALNLRPDLPATLDAGRGHGAVDALVSGSGPTCAFLARSAEHAADLESRLSAAGVCHVMRTGHGPVPGALESLVKPGNAGAAVDC